MVVRSSTWGKVADTAPPFPSRHRVLGDERRAPVEVSRDLGRGLELGGLAVEGQILLFVADRPVLSSLEFTLGLEGFQVADGAQAALDPAHAACLVVDQQYGEDGIAFLLALRQAGCVTPAILLVTYPTPYTRALASAAGALLVEKPLLGEELTRALSDVLQTRGAAYE